MKKKAWILLCAVVFLSACSSYRYYAVSNKPLSEGNYKTFAWIPEGTTKTSKIYNNDVAADRIIEATNLEMKNRGLTLENKNPDLLIRYTAGVNKETKSYSEPVYYNEPARLSPRIGYYKGKAFYYYDYYNPMPVYVGDRERNITVKAGSLMIDLIDRKTSKVIWRGWAEGEVENAEKTINDLPEVVANIFKKLN